MSIRLLCLSLLGWSLLTTDARAQDPSDAMFDPSALREVRVTMAPADWQLIVDYPGYDDDGTTPVYRCSFWWNGETLEDVGIRAKGQASREPMSPKPSVRFLFNSYEGEPLEGGGTRSRQEFRGLTKLDANSLRADSSMMRDRLIENAAARFGLPCPRTMHVRFYVNGSYVGLYLIVDQYDQSSQMRRLFGSRRRGNLYKCTWTRERGADDATRWRGDDPETYVGLHGVFAWKRRVTDQPDDLIHLLDVINNTSDADFQAQLPSVLNLDNFLSYCALNEVAANEDWMFSDVLDWGPPGQRGAASSNNWWWYGATRDPPTEAPLFSVLIWDVDGSMWDFTQEGWVRRDIRVGFGLHVLPRRVMNVPAWSASYIASVRACIDGPFRPDTVQSDIDRILPQIEQAARDDRNKPYGDQEFLDAVRQLREQIPQRVQNVRGQLGG